MMALMLSGSLVLLFVLAQRRKQQREDMEKLLQFTSHEFKTPVAGVKGLLQSLALGSIPEAQRAELIELGQHECDRLEHLAETILAYQRAMSREPREGVQPIDMQRFIADLLAHRARTDSGGGVEARGYRCRAGAGGPRRPASDPREPARQCAQVRWGQRAPGQRCARRALAARHQRPRPRVRLPKAPRSCSIFTTAEAAKASRMARAWGWRSHASSHAAWAATSPRAARGPGRARCSACHWRWRRRRPTRGRVAHG